MEQHGAHIQDFTIRQAGPEDAALILAFIRKLAVYEKMESDVTATEEQLREELFGKERAEVIIGEHRGRPVGFALYFHNFSTFLGHSNMYLEDLYVDESARGRGFGGALLARLAQTALERGCRRLDWCCLDWNAPSLAFYEGLGAKRLREWTVFRAEGDALERLARTKTT